MDWPAWMTTVVVGYATGFVTSQDFAIVDLTLNSDPPKALFYADLTPYAVTQRIKRLRRIGCLPGCVLVALWFALFRPSFRRRRTRMMFQPYAAYLGRLCGLMTSLAISSDLCFLVDTVILSSAALVTFAMSSYLRDYSREDYPVLNGVPTSNTQLEVPKSTYSSGSFLKGLLLASIPLALYENFSDAWQWSAETIYERVGLDKASLYSNALWDNVARAGFGSYIFSYGLFRKVFLEPDRAGNAEPNGHSQWKIRMLWVSVVSPSVLTSCLLYSRDGVDSFVHWFVHADTMFAIHCMSGVTSGTWYMTSHFPGDSGLVGISLARAIREVWKLTAEQLMLASIDAFGLSSFFVACLACRLLCSAVVCTWTPNLHADEDVVDDNATSNVGAMEMAPVQTVGTIRRST